jgi:predicted acetyltransferase
LNAESQEAESQDAPSPFQVNLEPAAAGEQPLIAQLLELYCHELSDLFPGLELGSDGRFGYPALPLYWAEPVSHFPFVLRAEGQLAGFALAKRGSPVSADPHCLDVAEFFVIKRFRGLGVAPDAAFQLWRKLPGTWTVRVLEENRPALAFWSKTVSAFAGQPVPGLPYTSNARAWRAFHFQSGHVENGHIEGARAL